MPKKKQLYYELGHKDHIKDSFDTFTLITACMQKLYTNPILYHSKGVGFLTDNDQLIFKCMRPSNRLMVVGIRNYLLSQLKIEEYGSLMYVNRAEIKRNNYFNYFKKID